MVYKHTYFELNTESQKVFDENGKELYITGNAYRMLAFLCGKQNAKISDLGEIFDRAKEYTEDHVRQYRYKINTIIGHKIVEYKNNVYSIIGNIEKSERNTDSLRLVQLQSTSMNNHNSKRNTVQFYSFPALIGAVLLLLGLTSLPYGYFTFLRIIVTIVAIYYAYYTYSILMTKTIWFWASLVIAILFNPIVPIYLYSRSTWHPIDIISAVFFIIMMVYLKKRIKS